MSAVCPQCKSAQNVTWQGRDGDAKQSFDLWVCTRDGREFRTKAR